MKIAAFTVWSAVCFITASFCIHFAVYRDRVGWLAVIALVLAGMGGFLTAIAATRDRERDVDGRS